MNSHRRTAYFYLLVTSIIWGAAGPVIKFTLADFPPLIFLTYRFALSAVVALIAFGGMPTLPRSPMKLFHILLYSVLAVPVTLGLLFFGFDKTSALEGSLITSLGPLIAVVAGAIFLHEHVTKREWLGVFVALAGTLLIVFEPLASGNHAIGDATIGNLLIGAAILSETVAFVSSKYSLREHITPFALSNVSFIIGFTLIAPLAFLVHGPTEILTSITSAPLSAHLGVWYMAFLSGTLAYTLSNAARRSIEMSETSVFSYLYPLWAAPLSIFWLKETLRPMFFVGAFIVATGVGISGWKSGKIHNLSTHRHSRRKMLK